MSRSPGNTVATRPDYEDILDNLYDGVYFVDRERRITYWNHGAERITGFAADDVIGRRCMDNILNHVDAAGHLLCTGACPLLATMVDGTPREADVFLHHANGHRVPVLVRCSALRDDEGEIVGAVESFSQELGLRSVRAELHEMRRTARTDALTGIGNRPFVEGKIRGLFAEYSEAPGEAAVAMIDIDHFKRINDRYGHAVGDHALRMLASTLKATMRATDEVGRWGGEEFVVILNEIYSLEDLFVTCDKLRALAGRSSFDAGNGRRGGMTISIGATLLRADDTPDRLMERADALLYESKARGRNRVTVG